MSGRPNGILGRSVATLTPYDDEALHLWVGDSCLLDSHDTATGCVTVLDYGDVSAAAMFEKDGPAYGLQAQDRRTL
jgi:hypothetical protein